jgi:hypothetical protein
MYVHRRFRILSIKYQPQLSDFDIYCIHSFFATLCVERHDVAFANVVDQTANVNKDFLFRGVVNYEAKSFGFIEELYGSSVH